MARKSRTGKRKNQLLATLMAPVGIRNETPTIPFDLLVHNAREEYYREYSACYNSMANPMPIATTEKPESDWIQLLQSLIDSAREEEKKDTSHAREFIKSSFSKYGPKLMKALAKISFEGFLAELKCNSVHDVDSIDLEQANDEDGIRKEILDDYIRSLKQNRILEDANEKMRMQVLKSFEFIRYANRMFDDLRVVYRTQIVDRQCEVGKTLTLPILTCKDVENVVMNDKDTKVHIVMCKSCADSYEKGKKDHEEVTDMAEEDAIDVHDLDLQGPSYIPVPTPI